MNVHKKLIPHTYELNIMKRGRPSKRLFVKEQIIKILESNNYPMTSSAICRAVSKEAGSTISWNTVYKYIRELVETNRIRPIILPHSKDSKKEGLTVYVIKQ